jgi:putative DNA primase/helicase
MKRKDEAVATAVPDEQARMSNRSGATSTDNDKKVIAQLAKLDPIEYERQRGAAASLLRVREAALDRCIARERAQASKLAEERNERAHRPKPWPKRVDGAELLDLIVREIRRYLALREGEAEVLGLWAAFTHADDLFSVSPRLWLQSPEPGCGKTTTMNVLYHLVADPLFTVDITAAALSREIDARMPTLLIDEADALLGSAELVRILNGGHERNLASVVRAVGQGTRKFSTFAPAAVATIKSLPPPLASRAISVRLRRRRPDEEVKPLNQQGMKKLRQLSQQAARWVLDNKERLSKAELEPDIPTSLQSRAADNWRPLLAIADVAGGSWPKRARQVAQLLAGTGGFARQSTGVMLLSDIRSSILTENADQIFAGDLAAQLAALEGRPWGDWKGRGPITSNEVATLLAPYDIEPSKVRRGTAVRSGYLAAQFREAFARYLNPTKQSHPSPTSIVTRLADAVRHIGTRVSRGRFSFRRFRSRRARIKGKVRGPGDRRR